MSFAKVFSAQTHYLNAHIISVEVDLSKGLYSFSIVGLPDKAVDEAKDRFSAAIKNSGFKSPKQKNQKVVVSLAPAEIKKEGSIFDLAIAIAYLLSSKAIKFDPKNKIFLGELSLDGHIKPIKGVLPLVIKAKAEGFEEIYLPIDNAKEGALVDGIKIFGVEHLVDLIYHLDPNILNIKDEVDEMSGEEKVEINREIKKLKESPKTKIESKKLNISIDFSHVKGNEGAKRGLLIAASGGHNVAMFGPPGTGKTMLAKAFSGILPPLSTEEMFEVTSIHSIAGILEGHLVTEVPFRSPHHTTSYNAVVGGGTFPKPGEITLAHRGVLFLDELPEFERRVIDSLRQPLEDKVVSISRVRGSVQFPAECILVATLNPCPCGNNGIKGKVCSCSPITVDRYKKKISGPIIDRIDMWVEVSKVEHDSLLKNTKNGEESESLRNKVLKAREFQKKRFEKFDIKKKMNSDLSGKNLESVANLSKEAEEVLNNSARKFDFSARVYHKLVKLARTIADLEESEIVKQEHILEALQYRPKQKI